MKLNCCDCNSSLDNQTDDIDEVTKDDIIIYCFKEALLSDYRVVPIPQQLIEPVPVHQGFKKIRPSIVTNKKKFLTKKIKKESKFLQDPKIEVNEQVQVFHQPQTNSSKSVVYSLENAENYIGNKHEIKWTTKDSDKGQSNYTMHGKILQELIQFTEESLPFNSMDMTSKESIPEDIKFAIDVIQLDKKPHNQFSFSSKSFNEFHDNFIHDKMVKEKIKKCSDNDIQNHNKPIDSELDVASANQNKKESITQTDVSKDNQKSKMIRKRLKWKIIIDKHNENNEN